MANFRRKIYEKRRGALDSERSTWISHWRDISNYILPRRGRYLNPATEHNKGTKKNSSIVDPTATFAAGVASSGMKAGLSSAARPWFKLGTPDTELKEWGPVKNWLYDAERRLYVIFARSNFYDVLNPTYEEMVTFGTANMHIEEDFNDVIRCYPFTIGSYCLALDSKMRVCSMYRTEPLTVYQMVERFGKDKVRRSIYDMWEKGNTEAITEVVHIIEPNDKRIPGRRDWQNMPYRSVYYDPADGEQEFLREGGYLEKPFCAPRWWVTANDVYGTSPGMVALGDVRQLQKDQRRKGKNIELIVNPPMVGPVSLKSQRTSTVPGDITYVETMTAGGQRFEPAWVANPNITPQLQNISEIQSRINEAFFKDLFLMLASSRSPQMTATEVLERHEEKMLMLGPVIERAENELLSPAIHRTLGIGVRRGVIPPPPMELLRSPLKVEYISILATAQKAAGLGGIERIAAFAGNLANVNPEVLDKLDFDQTIDEYAEMIVLPPRIVRSDEDVARIRQQRAQAKQQMLSTQLASQAAEGAKTLSETQVGGQNVLELMQGSAAT